MVVHTVQTILLLNLFIDTKLAVVPKEAESVAVCDVQDDSLTWSYVFHEESFTCGCLLQNSRYLAAGSKDTSVRLWDLKSKSIFRTFPVS